MRISDWSSDVCSSDLGARDDARRLHFDAHALLGLDRTLAVDRIAEAIDDAAEQALADEIGRESCRGRVCQYVLISVVAVSLKKKLPIIDTLLQSISTVHTHNKYQI